MRVLYERFCASAPPDFPLFMQPWYLDAVCAGGAWQAAVVEKDQRVIAVWPYFLKKKWGQTYVAMPPLARAMGPYLLPEYRNSRHENGLLENLLSQLPPLAAFEQDFNAAATNWLPFFWRGFKQTTRYTYCIQVSDPEAAWQNIRPNYRNQKIPRAAERVEVRFDTPPDVFYRIQNLSFSRQNLEAPFSFPFFQRLDNALQAHQARLILSAADRQSGAVHAAAYLVWDRGRSYYLLAGDDPALRQSGAGILLMWEAMRYTSDVLHLPVFDFAGSMIQPIEHVRRQFGAVQQPYFRVWKAWNPAWKLRWLGR